MRSTDAKGNWGGRRGNIGTRRLLHLLLLNRDLLITVDFVVRSRLLVLHVLGNQVLQVGFSFRLTTTVSYSFIARVHGKMLTNSSSSIPSPVYQCTKAFRLYMAENCSPIRLKSDWMEVELQMKVEDILRPRGGMSLKSFAS